MGLFLSGDVMLAFDESLLSGDVPSSAPEPSAGMNEGRRWVPRSPSLAVRFGVVLSSPKSRYTPTASCPAFSAARSADKILNDVDDLKSCHYVNNNKSIVIPTNLAVESEDKIALLETVLCGRSKWVYVVDVWVCFDVHPAADGESVSSVAFVVLGYPEKLVRLS